MGPGSFSVVAGGNITPSCFVKLATATSVNGSVDRVVVLCGAGDKIFGVSPLYQHRPAWDFLTQDGYAAVSGEPMQVYAAPHDSEAWVQCGGTVTPGDYLKADGSGFAITASGDGDEYGGQALEAGTTGVLIKIKLVSGQRGV